MRFLIAAFCLHASFAFASDCVGRPKSFRWDDVSLKIDSENSVVRLAHNAEGVGYGYQIEKMTGPAGRLYQAMGLKKGDVIIALNGIDFDSPFKATTDLASVKENTPFCLLYERAGKKIAQSFVRLPKKIAAAAPNSPPRSHF